MGASLSLSLCVCVDLLVFPAASRPNISSRISFDPKILPIILDICPPMLAVRLPQQLCRFRRGRSQVREGDLSAKKVRPPRYIAAIVRFVRGKAHETFRRIYRRGVLE
jgi:hypothetical protein